MAKGRQGLLTTAGFLAVNANTDATIPTTRGSFILSTLLCVDVPGVPSGVQLPDTGSDEPQTTRMKFEKIANTGDSCKSCHSVLDPIGFGLENFDATGNYRTMEEGLPINPASTLKSLPKTGSIQFANATELVNGIEQSLKFMRAVRQAFRYIIREERRSEDSC